MDYIMTSENELRSSFEMSSFDYQDLCRLCLAKDRVLVPIFEAERQILHKITTCRLPVQVLKEDKLPKKICDECLEKLEMFFQFWNTTLNVEEQLRQLTGEIYLEDKLLYDMQVLNSVNSRYDVAEMLNDISNTISAVSDEQFTSVSLDTTSTYSGQSTEKHDVRHQVRHLVQEIEKSQIKVSVPPGLQHQTNDVDHKNKMLQLTILEKVPSSNFTSHSELVHSASTFLQELPNPVTYVENVSNSICDQLLSSSLFIEKLSDSSSVSTTGFNKFPDPEFIADSELFPFSIPETEFIPRSMPEPEPIPKTNFQHEPVPHSISTVVISNPSSLPFEPIPNPMMTLNINTSEHRDEKNAVEENIPKKKWSIPNKDRPRRFRDQHFCSKCLVGFSDKVKLGKHMMEKHQIENPFECDICGKTFRSAVTISRHKRLHEEKPKQFTCDFCDYAAHQKSNLKAHINRRHYRKYYYMCQDCNAGFMQRTKFIEHKELCKKGKMQPCKYCPKTFRYRRNLRQHMVEHHPEMIPGPVEQKSRIPCPHCNRTFAKELSLQHHVKAQHLEPNKKCRCEECGALLSCKSALAQHMRRHRGEKVAKCNLCDKGFSKWQYLRVHQRVHTGERPYKCTHCSKAFTQRTTLVHHTRIHTGERPYKCHHCEKGFVSGSLLKKHTVNKCKKTLQEGSNTINEESSHKRAGLSTLNQEASKNEC